MSDWTYWLIGAGILIVAELFIGTFYLLMIAVGLLCGAGVAWLGASGPQQTLAAALVGIGATMTLAMDIRMASTKARTTSGLPVIRPRIHGSPASGLLQQAALAKGAYL